MLINPDLRQVCQEYSPMSLPLEGRLDNTQDSKYPVYLMFRAPSPKAPDKKLKVGP